MGCRQTWKIPRSSPNPPQRTIRQNAVQCIEHWMTDLLHAIFVSWAWPLITRHCSYYYKLSAYYEVEAAVLVRWSVERGGSIIPESHYMELGQVDDRWTTCTGIQGIIILLPAPENDDGQFYSILGTYGRVEEWTMLLYQTNKEVIYWWLWVDIEKMKYLYQRSIDQLDNVVAHSDTLLFRRLYMI